MHRLPLLKIIYVAFNTFAPPLHNILESTSKTCAEQPLTDAVMAIITSSISLNLVPRRASFSEPKGRKSDGAGAGLYERLGLNNHPAFAWGNSNLKCYVELFTVQLSDTIHVM